MNIMDMLQQHLPDDTLSKVAGATGLSHSETKTGMAAAIPAMLAALNASIGKLPPELRSPVQKQIATLTDNLRPAAQKALAIPGVGEKIKPTVDQTMTQLDSLAGRPATPDGRFTTE